MFADSGAQASHNRLVVAVQSTRWPVHSWPHSTPATMIGISSFTAMGSSWVAAFLTGPPFHARIKVCHHARSARNSVFRRIGTWTRCGSCPAWSRSIIRLRKERPALTTLQTWLSIPMSDSSSLREQDLRSPHCCRRDCSLCSFSSGRRSSSLVVSISKNTRHVDGPSVLCSAMGTPSSLHTWWRIERESLHWGDSGGQTMMKSS